ncbi:SIMPL domain-containing protein [Halovenus sp. HT40]|uniref:SIMPL domain-containing protein n=1 Tax=Halovenus sp. HT40 TaxID=3126691 RepID=UPI00300EEAE0
MRAQHTLVVAVLAIAVSVAGVGALAAVSDGTATAAAQDGDSETVNDSDAPDRRIHVSAVGEAKAEPDQAVARVAITAEADSVGEVRDELATGSNSLTSALDELGVEYETAQYDISERHQRRTQQPPAEYEGTHAYEITADDPTLAGEVADTAASAGAEIGSVTLTLSADRREELRSTAIDNALQDASDQSEAIADASGLEVVAPVSVDASQRRFVPAPFESAQADGDDGGPPTEIAAGTVSVTYEVDVTYEALRD